METIILLISVVFISFVASVYKVDEAVIKNKKREEIKNFAFLSSKGYMQLIVFLALSPLFFFINWEMSVIFIVLILSLLRFVFWVTVNIARGYYSDALHQGSSNFTMLENFSGPLGALLVFGIYNYFINSSVSIFWYILTPFIGIFLLWALRSPEGRVSPEMIKIIALQGLLVASETLIILYLQNSVINYVQMPTISFLPFLDSPMIVFLTIISISSLLSSLYFSKEIVKDYKVGMLRNGLKIGVISGVHDIFYFIGFMFFGPIFLIARRGLLVPIQNLYINLKDNKNIVELIQTVYKKPLLSLNGGKDFIISFVDIVFNQVVKFIIKILS